MARRNEGDIEGLKRSLIEIKDQIGDIERNFGNRVKQRAIEAEKKIENKIEDYPLQSVGIAFGAGMVAGIMAFALMRR
ncbi:MAG: hypothetical protein PHV16_05230, partial [Candidatus Nanoarchaeia archaeon]|nr:hypothetical protein [Candidatus Nanoarchaeia archaeon]